MRSQPISAVFKPGDRVHLKHHARTRATIGTVTRRAPDGRVFVQWDDNGSITPQETDYLEPAGEPMSTTFKSSSQASDNRTLSVERLYGDPRLLISGENRIGFMIDPSDAPALSLAILEAAGFEADSDDASSLVNSAMGRLAMHVATEATKAKETADREALEGEAWAFYVSARISEDVMAYTSMGEMDPSIKARWINVATAARELHGVTK